MMKNALFTICLFFMVCNCQPAHKGNDNIGFVRQEVAGRYPIEQSIKYTLLLDNREMPVFCYANVLKGNIVSLELSRTQEKTADVSSDIVLEFFAKTLESLSNKDKSKLSRIYTKTEYLGDESQIPPQEFSGNTLQATQILKESNLLNRIKSILERNKLHVVDIDCDMIRIERKPGHEQPILCGDLYLNVKFAE